MSEQNQEVQSRKSNYRGVSWNKRANKWQVVVNTGYTLISNEDGTEKRKQNSKSVGLYLNEKDAAKAYNSYITQNSLNKTLNEVETSQEEIVFNELEAPKDGNVVEDSKTPPLFNS